MGQSRLSAFRCAPTAAFETLTKAGQSKKGSTIHGMGKRLLLPCSQNPRPCCSRIRRHRTCCRACSSVGRNRKEEAKHARFILKQEKAELTELDGNVRAAYEEVESIARAALLAAGYHRHKRGEWRKSHGQSKPDD